MPETAAHEQQRAAMHADPEALLDEIACVYARAAVEAEVVAVARPRPRGIRSPHWRDKAAPSGSRVGHSSKDASEPDESTNSANRS